ncbi:MAG: Fe(2+)-trafficking protein [Deltaproteobacteria bacterium]|nr:Fe(2+)-trafficking protein [Deltaproteobacteria bacterium]
MATKLENAPFPTKLGEEILAKVSQEDWAQWLEMQTKIINEYRLDLSESEDRTKLLNQMRSFLKLDGAKEAVLEVGTPT